ncbi:MAG: DUF3303 family protein [Rhodospirillales bacterium]|jgi:hypothetical protein|nr:DUF3303 family protein [Rhodospirillales bacterium]|tara:strand:+ start:1554 stop:1838 length:285 start_codon:yes stop_codon:yes gene_type:complete
MLFTFAWTHSTHGRNATIKQFMATGGMPPEGVKMISRYHNIDGSGGFAICETDDASALANWAIDWNGLLDVKITAIMDDETIGGVLGPRASEFE